MVLKITDICNMGCTHCLSDCTMTSHIKDLMDEDTLWHSIDFIDAIKELESIQKFCHPCINTDGSLTLGESSLCKTVGTIYDSIDDLTEKTRKFSCKQCQWINEQLPDIYKQYIVFE